ncbi:LPS O-antigen length regulator Wzz(fepE) [Yersinia mollaretii]|uniref:LPS O-antigen length regulator Wzz(fepE) n=1 Tax=Yersinia mollaretii TaxID=33060 RepID=UPI0025AA66CB|nr:LPS O-antigen length regulator Wzz(fepE) [Yersinia mollaretii]MDN0109163.1 LPS O-antigen length regulator Wzz(fepE) [Yersinia mollaretii]
MSGKKKPFSGENVSNLASIKNINIEIKEMILIIYNSKIVIILIVILFILLAYGIGIFIPQKWSSTSIIILPQEQQLQPLNKVISELSVLDIKHDITSEYLIKLFMNNFDSKEIRENFLVGTDYFKELMLTKNILNDSLEERQLVQSIIDRDISSYSSSKDKLSDKKEYDYYLLTYTASTPDNAHYLLKKYIDYVIEITNEDLHRRIAGLVDLKMRGEIQNYDIEFSKLHSDQDVIKERLKYSISIANAAGIKRPLLTNHSMMNDDPDFSIALGADAMMRKLQLMESITDITRLNAGLLNRNIIIEKLKRIDFNKIDIEPLKYFQKPQVPTTKNGPEMLVIIILAAFSGFIFSSSFVLIRYYINKSRS